jgi:hypothetical protein
MKHVIESTYPVGFRKKEAAELAEHIQNNHSVVIVGMKRVGISNFLRFFLSHNEAPLFVQVDLNDLIERNISAFWTLLLTRLVDAVQRSAISEKEKSACRRLFVQSIQLKDQFFTVESVRKVLEALVSGGESPTLFLLRFDRLAEVITPEFFSNLIGLRDALKNKVNYVFTSFRSLPDLAPDVFQKAHVSVFAKDMYLAPASASDMAVILTTLEEQYHTRLDPKTRDSLIAFSGGYVQYLQLGVIRLKEEKMSDDFFRDEQISFQSEELFESLTKIEKEVLLNIKQGNTVTKEQREQAKYLWNTGMVHDEKEKTVLFSPLFDDYVGRLSMVSQNGKEFTKKEHLLFVLLQSHEGELCERETIIDAVWPETKESGVSDWAIDRLVARLRSKLKSHGSPFTVVTVVTRGYKLVKA